ncbi:hypothetical protein [Bacillus paramycoides]|uniref:hypothetical protein n=1 Tax=Bacillus paramycoides TaxID=2026194 RepID=UPI002E23CF35|nr:hypothetical protein [Bacillus paramycoides]MED0980018.1 hypothetical protein [Bacillus paramycoides]MED0985014.1 hypothetical protein [Bacillus paramycoides]MED1092251.1 hypothetical protein [Bacillus paramycoides]MED1103749.1 hypothetical protein [Bacillus paramycoides]
MKSSENLYHEGNYRFWLNIKTGSLRMKLNGDKELYTIPKNSKLYDRLMNDFFSNSVKIEESKAD